MVDLTALGPAAVDESVLTGMVARLLSRPVDRLVDVGVEEVDYDTPAITTASRHWVRGSTDEGVAWSLFCKHVQSWERHPFFAFVPPEVRERAAGGVPWRSEPEVYRSDLAARLPPGLTMPRAVGVFDLDELSAAVWLPALDVVDVPWDRARYTAAAYAVGRFAASPGVRAVADGVGHDVTVWTYLHGRLAAQVLPALRDDATWEHPLVAQTFGPELRDGLRSAAYRAEALTAELAGLPLLASHGDTCPNNLLGVRGVEGLCLIDYGFFGPMPVGFDLAQLLVGDVQTGAAPYDDLPGLDDALVSAYAEGLRAEGDRTPLDVVRRGHALKLVLYAALSAVPLEHLHEPPSERLLEVARGRAAIARHGLELLERTG